MPFLSAHSGVGHSGGSGGSGGQRRRPGSSAAAAARSASSSAAGRRGQHRRPAPSNRGAGGAISSKRKRRHPAPSSGIGARLARAYSCRKWLTRCPPLSQLSRSRGRRRPRSSRRAGTIATGAADRGAASSRCTDQAARAGRDAPRRILRHHPKTASAAAEKTGERARRRVRPPATLSAPASGRLAACSGPGSAPQALCVSSA